MPFRLPLTEAGNPTPLRFDCTIGYIEELRAQLGGEKQPIHPCLVFRIRSFGTLGPRLGVYLNGTSYDSISSGELGHRPDGDGKSSHTGVDNTHVGISLEVADEQLVELYSIYQSVTNSTDPPYTWATTIPNEVVPPFDRQASLLTGRLREALYEQLPQRVECAQCGSRHSRQELRTVVTTHPDLSYLQSQDDMDPRRIQVSAYCPTEQSEIQIERN